MAVTRIATSSLKTLNKSDSFLNGNAYYVPPSYESIATVTGNGSATTLTLSSIPSTYTHLQVRGIVRNNRASTDDTVIVYFNGDSATGNYSAHGLRGNGTAASAFSTNGGLDGIGISLTPASSATANVFNGTVVDILDYKNTNKYKTIRSLGGFDTNGSGFIELRSGAWLNTAAITSITISNGSVSAFSTYSSFALYGIKG